MFISGSMNGALNLCNIERGKILFTILARLRNFNQVQWHPTEIISLDFNKYEQQIVTSSIDKTIRLWDLRNLTKPINMLEHNRYPPKKVKFSPHIA